MKIKKATGSAVKGFSDWDLSGLLKSLVRPPDRILQKPSAAAIARLKAVPLLFEKDRFFSTDRGHIANDSWRSTPALALRDVTDGHIRRLRLESKKVSLEIVAEKVRCTWEYTARVYFGNNIDNRYVLNAGGRKLLPYSDGFYHWSSSRVPRAVSLISHRNKVVFERVPW